MFRINNAVPIRVGENEYLTATFLGDSREALVDPVGLLAAGWTRAFADVRNECSFIVFRRPATPVEIK